MRPVSRRARRWRLGIGNRYGHHGRALRRCCDRHAGLLRGLFHDRHGHHPLEAGQRVTRRGRDGDGFLDVLGGFGERCQLAAALRLLSGRLCALALVAGGLTRAALGLLLARTGQRHEALHAQRGARKVHCRAALGRGCRRWPQACRLQQLAAQPGVVIAVGQLAVDDGEACLQALLVHVGDLALNLIARAHPVGAIKAC
mmetsp:Transcript_21338/g.66120  ORF Transcript_21338/g.66120 Transcript_21338/m.66120 type:complete len:200 (+) Transcript_21338:193-792(+)